MTETKYTEKQLQEMADALLKEATSSSVKSKRKSSRATRDSWTTRPSLPCLPLS